MKLNELTDVVADDELNAEMFEPSNAHAQPASVVVDRTSVEYRTPLADQTARRWAANEAPVPDAPPVRKRTLKPAPGQVIVLRSSIEPYYTNTDGSRTALKKPQHVIDDEERSNVLAVIARVGDDDLTGNRTAWFKAGDEVVIAPHVFTEIVIAGGADGTVWLGPFAGVKGLFEYEAEELEDKDA